MNVSRNSNIVSSKELLEIFMDFLTEKVDLVADRQQEVNGETFHCMSHLTKQEQSRLVDDFLEKEYKIRNPRIETEEREKIERQEIIYINDLLNKFSDCI